ADQSPPPIVRGRRRSSPLSWSRSEASRSCPSLRVSSASCRVGAATSGSGLTPPRHGHVPPGVARPDLPAQVHMHVLHLPVLVEPELAMLPADAGLLVPAAGIARVDHVVVVDP